MALSEDFIRVLKLQGEAFGGRLLGSAERGREIWQESVHKNAIWEGPTFE